MPVLLRRPDVQQRTGLSRSSLYNLIKEGRFPRPVQISDRSVAWVSDDIDSWINTQIKNGQTSAIGERIKSTYLRNLKELDSRKPTKKVWDVGQLDQRQEGQS
jgi:prophage regulatory protein